MRLIGTPSVQPVELKYVLADMPSKRLSNSYTSDIEQMHLNTFSTSLISLTQFFFLMKARQLQVQCYKLLHLTSTHYSLTKYQFFNHDLDHLSRKDQIKPYTRIIGRPSVLQVQLKYLLTDVPRKRPSNSFTIDFAISHFCT